jgi:predicted lipoprotein
MARGAADVADLWENDASRFASDSRALADLVSALADAVYLIADTELAMPAGSRAGTSPDPKLVRGRAGAMSLEDAQTQLDAIKAAHLAGVAPILDARSPEAAASINTALDAARAALSAIPGDLQGAVVTQREVVLAAAEACRQVQRTYATQVAGSLGLTLNVPAGDGD